MEEQPKKVANRGRFKTKEELVIERQFIDNAKGICQELFKKKNTRNENPIRSANYNKDGYVESIYKLDEQIYRIIVGKKEAVATKGFSWIDKKLLGDIGEIKLEEKNGKYKLTKIAQRKTSEKYADTGAGNDKKEFHFRYKIYLGGPLQVRALSNTVYAKDINDNMKLAVLKHFGYDFTKQLGKGGYGTAYLDSKEAKNGIMRVIKVCLNDEIEIKKEWKGVNTAYKTFDKIKNPDSDTKKLREEFYKNESIVFNKNKAMGQISEITGYTTEPRYERYWYCISTSEYRTGGEAFSVSDEDRELFKNDNKALWIELQAFAKDILTGLSIFHKQDTAHLDVKLANIFKTKTSVKDGGSKYKYAIADHTMAFNKNEFMDKLARKYENNYPNLNGEELKKKIWDDETEYDYKDENKKKTIYKKEIYPKLYVGTRGYNAPDIVGDRLPYEYDPCIADSYSAGKTIEEYKKILSGSDNLKDSVLEAQFKKLVDDLTVDNWNSRLSCTDALDSSFITAKIQ